MTSDNLHETTNIYGFDPWHNIDLGRKSAIFMIYGVLDFVVAWSCEIMLVILKNSIWSIKK